MTLLDQLHQLIFEIKNKMQNQTKPFLIAIDGRSGSGKSTIAKKLAHELNAVVIMGDDFCSAEQSWANKTPQEKAELCIDWKRLRKEVLEILLQGKTATYFPFNFEAGSGLSDKFITINSAPVIILDGAYSARPELSDLVDMKILVELSNAERRERLLKREGKVFMKTWHATWDVAEDYYFSQCSPPDSFDFVITVDDQ